MHKDTPRVASQREEVVMLYSFFQNFTFAHNYHPLIQLLNGLNGISGINRLKNSINFDPILAFRWLQSVTFIFILYIYIYINI